ncbi:MAG: preprotein translocase subunit SecG [Alphaproteobacteria bacterium]|nr:preprotein translocase subunit SecG [Alphaproteobacteria bacterium]MBQ7285623.1 preprotein translocase subunit SecG [Alphaproteobacteria bacterium]
MGSVLLVIHLLACIFLVAVILLQRSSGGALDGLGGGSGASSFLNARGTGNLLTRTTAILAVILFCTSISLSLYYKGVQRQSGSILENTSAQTEPTVPSVPQAPVAGK